MKKILSKACSLLILMLFFSGSSGDQKSCELRKECDGIKVFSCKSEKSDFNDIEAEFELKASFKDYIALVKQVERYDEWHYRSANPRLLKVISETELIYYEQVRAPWPVSDRDLIIRCRLLQNEPAESLTVILESIPDYMPVKEEIVRISHFYSIMTLTRKGNSGMQVKFHLEVDPGGVLPAWLVNTASTQGPYETFMSLKEKIESN